jgi:hypothetical protein
MVRGTAICLEKALARIKCGTLQLEKQDSFTASAKLTYTISGLEG